MAPVDPDEVSLFRDSEHIPAHHWQDLLSLDPQEVCRRALVAFEPGKGFLIPFLNWPYVCQPEATRIWREDRPEKSPSFQECLVLLVYLHGAQENSLDGTKVSERELPGGELFFRGPHALLTEPLEKKFAQDPQGFLQAGLNLNGQATGLGEASFELLVLPRIPVEYILYVEDEEFPAQITINFDRTISRHLPLDVIWALINLTSRRLCHTPRTRL
ncbi:MAG: hypothetical protein C0407_09075 [Desulfobacca sp.]|nr:hypothetical protein [Desulfobacca sp.]